MMNTLKKTNTQQTDNLHKPKITPSTTSSMICTGSTPVHKTPLYEGNKHPGTVIRLTRSGRRRMTRWIQQGKPPAEARQLAHERVKPPKACKPVSKHRDIPGPPGDPGYSDPFKKGLNGASRKWYMRYQRKGIGPELARKMVEARRGGPSPFKKINYPSSQSSMVNMTSNFYQGDSEQASNMRNTSAHNLTSEYYQNPLRSQSISSFEGNCNDAQPYGNNRNWNSKSNENTDNSQKMNPGLRNLGENILPFFDGNQSRDNGTSTGVTSTDMNPNWREKLRRKEMAFNYPFKRLLEDDAVDDNDPPAPLQLNWDQEISRDGSSKESIGGSGYPRCRTETIVSGEMSSDRNFENYSNERKWMTRERTNSISNDGFISRNSQAEHSPNPSSSKRFSFGTHWRNAEPGNIHPFKRHSDEHYFDSRSDSRMKDEQWDREDGRSSRENISRIRERGRNSREKTSWSREDSGSRREDRAWTRGDDKDGRERTFRQQAFEREQFKPSRADDNDGREDRTFRREAFDRAQFNPLREDERDGREDTTFRRQAFEHEQFNPLRNDKRDGREDTTFRRQAFEREKYDSSREDDKDCREDRTFLFRQTFEREQFDPSRDTMQSTIMRNQSHSQNRHFTGAENNRYSQHHNIASTSTNWNNAAQDTTNLFSRRLEESFECGARRCSPNRRGRGDPGGVDDPFREGLSRTGRKLYYCFLEQGMTPQVARQMVDERKNNALAASLPSTSEKKFIENPSASATNSQHKQTTTSDSSTGSLKKSRAQISTKIKVAVMATDYPKYLLVRRQLKVLEEIITMEIKGFKKPRTYTACKHKSGYLIISCVDMDAANRLINGIPKLKRWNDVELKTCMGNELPTTEVMSMAMPRGAQMSMKKILGLIASQNKGVLTARWNVLGSMNKKSSKLLIAEIDQESLYAIRGYRNRLNSKFGTILVRQAGILTRKVLTNFTTPRSRKVPDAEAETETIKRESEAKLNEDFPSKDSAGSIPKDEEDEIYNALEDFENEIDNWKIEDEV